MVEMEENGGTFHDWGDLIGSPNRLISEEFPFEVDTEKIDDGSVVNNEEEVEESGVYNDATTQFPVIDGKVRSRGSIAERRAAKCGFSASRINVARFRATSPLSSPSAWSSPFLTIPAGISPTALLDSPIMLPNSQPSPTTGTLPLPPLNHEAFTLNSMSAVAVGDRNIDIDSSFTFQPHGGSLFWPCISDLQNQPPMLSEFPAELSKETATKNCSTDSSSEVIVSTNTIQNTKSAAVQPIRIDNQVPPLREPIEGDDTGKHLLEEYQKETYPPTARTSEDGYNWRKYGQKQVKGSEYPRSYYKCTHPNCPVKKKVERSHDGQITEIIYKGAHNHHIPHLNQRTILGSPASLNDMSETGEANGSYIKIEGGEVWRNIQLGCNDIKVGSDWRADGLEGSSSTSVLTDISDPLANTQGKSMGVIESATTPELSSTNGNRDGDDEDGATLGTLSPGDDASEDKSEFKRRKKGSFLVESNLLSRAMREPRVVVQIESEVDILDDGYRWRKYGQKVVKGNPNPRSYYKCTSAGCSVRKHVERASDNLKAVLTTYEGKHNHEVPAARNSSHANMDVGNLPPAHNTHPNLTLPRISNVPKSQAQVQDLPFRFERKFCNDNYMTTSNLVGNFVSEASSIYQGKFVPFQNSMSFGSTVPSVLPNFNPMSLPMSIPSASANMVRRGFGFNNPIGQVQSYVGGQQFRENNSRFLKPKQEQDDNIYDTFMPVMDHANDSSSRAMAMEALLRKVARED